MGGRRGWQHRFPLCGLDRGYALSIVAEEEDVYVSLSCIRCFEYIAFVRRWRWDAMRRRTTLPLALPLYSEAFSRPEDNLPLAISAYFDMMGEESGVSARSVYEATKVKKKKNLCTVEYI